MRAADPHYDTMTTADIAAMRVPAADDAVLYLWATAPMMPQAEQVMAAWGFTYSSQIVWAKDRNRHGLLGAESARTSVDRHQGIHPAPTPGTQPPSVIFASVGAHSEKPDVFAEIIETSFPGVARLEMFARKPRGGWTVHGDKSR